MQVSHAVTQNQKDGCWGAKGLHLSICLQPTTSKLFLQHFLLLMKALAGDGSGFPISAQDCKIWMCPRIGLTDHSRYPGQETQQEQQVETALCISPRMLLPGDFPFPVAPFTNVFFSLFFQSSERGGKTHQSGDGKWKSARSGQISKQCGKTKKLNASEIHW